VCLCVSVQLVVLRCSRLVSSEDDVIITVISFRLRFLFLVLWSVSLLSLCLVSMLSVSEAQ